MPSTEQVEETGERALQALLYQKNNYSKSPKKIPPFQMVNYSNYFEKLKYFKWEQIYIIKYKYL